MSDQCGCNWGCVGCAGESAVCACACKGHGVEGERDALRETLQAVADYDDRVGDALTNALRERVRKALGRRRC